MENIRMTRSLLSNILQRLLCQTVKLLKRPFQQWELSLPLRISTFLHGKAFSRTSVLAFLLVNNLLSRELFFLTDGAQDLRSHIRSVFQFHPYTTILDWFHLKKGCQEWLSMAIRGKDRRNTIRNTILEKVLRYLWAGDVTGASEYLSSLDPADIKNRKGLDDFLGYFEKKGDAITCYALRAKLGLRNSSNPVEKANDLIVAGRQKHNGMAWSPNGSGALAALQMIYLNHQSDLWFHRKELRLFSPSLEDTQKAA